MIASMAIASTISAQPAVPPETPCAQRSALERDMEVARSKGQMLRRQRLERQVEQLRSYCNDAGSTLTHGEQVERQQKVVSELERELSDAREVLNRLLTKAP
ncbi:MAG: DUF1090 domain-containing protein [Gammaproteobacteria bacterium]|nr:DUF1090 domain-containing protein [Gammaproteobacteria bacterium]MBU2410075.1 DUF1090 domain-containing protein [Gammaproteobacteria bacterium]